MDNVTTIRKLTFAEDKTLRLALEKLLEDEGSPYSKAAEIMLEDNMTQRFLFAERQ